MRYIFILIFMFLNGCASFKESINPELKYNYYENEWSYVKPGVELRFNYYEGRYEYVK